MLKRYSSAAPQLFLCLDVSIVILVGDVQLYLAITNWKYNRKVIGGVILLLTNKEFTSASSLYLKSKQINRVSHSLKDTKKVYISKMIDGACFARKRLETLLFDHSEKIMKVHLFTN